MVEKLIFHNAHFLTVIFQAKSTDNIFRPLSIHLHVPGGQVQQEQWSGHHVGGGHVLILIVQAKSTENIFRALPKKQ